MKSITGQISDRLDEIFGGEGSFDKYFETNIPSIKSCMNAIEKLV